jgi:hypothetical protein
LSGVDADNSHRELPLGATGGRAPLLLRLSARQGRRAQRIQAERLDAARHQSSAWCFEGEEKMATVLEKPEVSNALPPQKVKGRQCAMHIPDGGFFSGKVEQGRFGPVFPRTPLNFGFTIIAKIKPGTRENFHNYARNVEKAVAETPDVLDVLKLHTLKWVLFDINGETYFMYQGVFDTDFDKYTEDAVAIFAGTGLDTVFENLENFPPDWKTNPNAFIEFVRKHHCPSFMEYAEYSYVSAAEVKSALAVKSSFADVLDNMQL